MLYFPLLRPDGNPRPNQKEKKIDMYVRDTLTLPAEGRAPLHTPS